MFDYAKMAERLANKYLRTEEGKKRLFYDLKEIYNHQFIEGFEVVIDNLMSGAYDSRENLINVTEFEFKIRSKR